MTHLILYLAFVAAGFGLGRIHNRKAVEAKIKAAVAEVKSKL